MSIFNKLFVAFLLFFIPLSSYSQNKDVENNLKKYVDFITADSLLGRAAGSNGEKTVANYIYDQLIMANVDMLTPRDGEDFYFVNKDTLQSRNIIGVIPGYDKNLNNEYIVIGAHLDHLGVNSVNNNGNVVKQIYSGADDNASGIATLLETAKLISQNRFMFRRSVVFAFFGAEELGMVGSWYFLNRSFKDTNNIVMMINLDMVGRSTGENKMQVFTASDNPDLSALIKGVSQKSIFLKPSVSSVDYFPSDHRLFHQKGIPVVLFTSGVHRDYHTPRDTKDKLDYNQMAHLSEFVYSLSEVAANRDSRVSKSVYKEVIESKEGKDLIYTQQDVDKRASFIHGDEKQFLDKWVYPYIKYPSSAIDSGVEGRVIVEFIVGKDGKVKDVKIVRGLDNDIDDEVVKVVSASPKWKAAQINNMNVNVKISIPIEFRLSKEREFKIKR